MITAACLAAIFGQNYTSKGGFHRSPVTACFNKKRSTKPLNCNTRLDYVNSK